MMRKVLAATAMIALAAGCGGRNRENTVTIKGSDTMVILGQRWAEVYMKEHPGVTIQVTGGGSGTGIAALINNGTDICEASRPMTPEEFESIKSKRGAEAKEIPVALDGIAIYVNEQCPLKAITVDQLEGVYTGKIKDWKELKAGSGPIVAYGRENNSGTYAFFKEHVLKNADFAAEVQSLPGTAAVVNAVAKDVKAVGYGGIAYAHGVNRLKVSPKKGKPAIAPDEQAVVTGRYPISRKLFFYTAGDATGKTAEFIAWALSAEGQKICAEVGYYPLTAVKAARKPGVKKVARKTAKKKTTKK